MSIFSYPDCPLKALEMAFWRMNAGVFVFTFYRLPRWICFFLLEDFAPIVIRLARAAVALVLWLAVVFGPLFVVAAASRRGGMAFMAIPWVVLAAAGSLWGYHRLRRRQREAAAEGGAS